MADPLSGQVVWNAAAIAAMQRDLIGPELQRRGLKVEAAAKQIVHVDTGRLRASIATELTEIDGAPAALIGSTVEYAMAQEVMYPYLRPSLGAAGG